MIKVRKAVIPAAGLGTRFLPITKTVPKELLPIGSKPSIQYVVEEAVAAGIEEIILVCSPGKTAVLDYFKPDLVFREALREKGKKEELEELERIESLARFSVVFQEEPKGLGHAILSARRKVGDESFVILLPDVLVSPFRSGVSAMIEACRSEEDWCLLLEQLPPERIQAYGIVGGKLEKSGLFLIDKAVEKPSLEEAPSDLSILGRYLFTPEIFDLIEKSKPGRLGEIQLTDAINVLAKKRAGLGVVCKGEVFDVGVPEGLVKAWNYFQKNQFTRP